MTSKICDKCDCVEGCSANPVPCPNLARVRTPPEDFGIPAEFADRAENYANWKAAQTAPVRQPLAPDEIQTIALENGFKLKEQLDGAMRLNPYVFDFVSAIESAHGIAQPKNKP